ncbi:BEL1-like homeodomain protein 6 isoform X1 [Nymphaea colorata]|nr:BEL1-like homeodomain protein 6 isoform X1 [Nymphaea colorata]
MATYFPGSSSQNDVMPTLYLKDGSQNPFPDSALPGHVMYMNYSSASTYTNNLPGHPRSPQNCVELPAAGSMVSQDSHVEVSRPTASYPGIISNLVAPRLEESILNTWRDGRNEMFMQPRVTLTNMLGIREQINGGNDLARNTLNLNPEVGMGTPLSILQGGQGLQVQRADVAAVQGQGLSLSLGTHIPSAITASPFQFHHENPDVPFVGSQSLENEAHKNDGFSCKQPSGIKFPPAFSGTDQIAKGDTVNNFQPPLVVKQMHMGGSSYGLTNLASTITNSKYLKAAQQLLDEVVNVRNALRSETNKGQSFQTSTGEMDTRKNASGNPSSTGLAQESMQSVSNELSPAERQEMQAKLTQLLSMQDEVDRRYKQYYHQMQIVVSSFDVIAGCGAAKTYTTLALQTISRHFRCLRDAISGQVQAARKNLGEQDPSNGKGGGITRLRFVDQQLRQQRALQQLGMLQQHAWRPQRGLPESSVSILRAWLFEHFLHPYPSDSDKLMLARQTGLSRSQVSNWFINARVRLWKPMVEEMYKEEIGEAEADSNSSSENAAKDDDSKRDPKETELQGNRQTTADKNLASENRGLKTNFILDTELASADELNNSPHVVEDSSNYGNTKFRDQRSRTDQCNPLQDALLHSDTGERFISYQMAGLGRLENDSYTAKGRANGGVSLTLGLQHCDGGQLAVSSEPQTFVATQGEDMYNSTSVSTTTSNYEFMNMGSRTQRWTLRGAEAKKRHTFN